MLRIQLAVMFVASITAVASAQSLAEDRKALDAAHAASCGDTCCVPRVEDFEYTGGGPAELARARTALATKDPQIRALALRILAPGATDVDVETLEGLIDDTRSGGELPAVLITQQVMQCYPVSWETVTVASEALAALSRFRAIPFRDAKAYRAWAVAHPVPELTADAWLAKLERSRPPDAALLASLRKRDPVLVARVLAVYCAEPGSCGVTPSELADVFRKAGGGDRLLRWLARDEQFPEWQQDYAFERVVESILRVGDTVFAARHKAKLDALMRSTKLSTYLRAQLAVMLGRMTPADAPALWTWALHDLDQGQDAVLREAAAHAPSGFAATIAAWYPRQAEAIMNGLVDAGPRGAATFHQLLAAHPIKASDEELLRPVAAAALAVGCANVPDPAQLIPRLVKGSVRSLVDAEATRMAKVRTAVVAGIRACITAPK